MLLNYIKIAIRNILRHKVYSIINILGLAIGMACAILLLLFVRDELSYDKHNSKYKRIYMVQSYIRMEDQEKYSLNSPSLSIGQTLKDEILAIENTARTSMSESTIYFTNQDGEIMAEDKICYADQEIFKIFDHEFIYGTPEGALDSPNTIVLSETLARKYFGEQNPIGEILSRKEGADYIVKGVFKDLPKTSFQRYDALIPMHEILKLSEPQQIDANRVMKVAFDNYTFILLAENAGITNIIENYERFREKILDKSGIYSGSKMEIRPVFQSLANVYLQSKPWPNSPVSVLQRVYIMSALALFILIIACINYINLATARSAGRAREVGIRKALGAEKVFLIRQFLCESIVITFIAMLTSLALTELFLPSFNTLVSKKLSLGAIGGIDLFAGILIITLLAGFMAGSYPAFLLSSFSPVKVLRGDLKSYTDRGLLINVLVIIQYSISVIIIICTILLIKQMNYIHHKNLGFNKNNVFIISTSMMERNRTIPAFKEDILKQSEILAVAESSSTAGVNGINLGMGGQIEGPNGDLINKNFRLLTVDMDFIDLMEMKILEGRSFNLDTKTDKEAAVLVNEAFVKDMGWTDSPIGKRVFLGKNFRIVGVLKNFHFRSLHSDVRPQIIMLNDDSVMNVPNIVSIKVSTTNSKNIINFVKEKWLELNPMYPADIVSLEDAVNNQYRIEEATTSIFMYSSFLGIFISCLGLFGLSSFIAENKTKEIGVRKVFGASVGSIVFKLSINFLKLVLIASIIACPIAYYVMSKWLDNFAYRIDMSWWVFVTAVGIAMVIALVTVSYHAVKAALTDPVKALRYE